MTLDKLELRNDEWLNDPPGYVHRHGWPGPVRLAPWGDLIVGSRELISSLGKAPWRACSIEYLSFGEIVSGPAWEIAQRISSFADEDRHRELRGPVEAPFTKGPIRELGDTVRTIAARSWASSHRVTTWATLPSGSPAWCFSRCWDCVTSRCWSPRHATLRRSGPSSRSAIGMNSRRRVSVCPRWPTRC